MFLVPPLFLTMNDFIQKLNLLFLAEFVSVTGRRNMFQLFEFFTEMGPAVESAFIADF